MNHGLAMKPRKYSDILVGQFEIGKIIRVNRKNDEHTISDKIFWLFTQNNSAVKGIWVQQHHGS